MTGLHKKYRIFKGKSKQEDKSPAFVLKPVSDPAAREAIRVYATFIIDDNPDLYLDLVEWINKIEDRYGIYDWEKHQEEYKQVEPEKPDNRVGEEWL